MWLISKPSELRIDLQDIVSVLARRHAAPPAASASNQPWVACIVRAAAPLQCMSGVDPLTCCNERHSVMQRTGCNPPARDPFLPMAYLHAREDLHSRNAEPMQ